jgi:hypothetical protein
MFALATRGFSITPVAIISLAGCGADYSDRADAAASARSLFQAVDDHDGRAACAALVPAATDRLTTGDSTCKDEIMKAGLTGGPISQPADTG